MLRRRMSRLTRMSIVVAADCCRQAGISVSDVRTVFASRHGEMQVTVELLKQMVVGSTISPIDFSGSVHHTALGYLSIASKSLEPMRAVAGGEASFCYGFLEALGMLAETDGSPVLLIAADDIVPAPFDDFVRRSSFPYAVAFLLSSARSRQGKSLTFTIPSGSLNQTQRKSDSKWLNIPALDFLYWYLKRNNPLELRLSKRNWRWEK